MYVTMSLYYTMEHASNYFEHVFLQAVAKS